MTGGPDFLTRLQQLGNARDEAAKAMAELKLAKTAQAAMADADAKRKSADDALQTAQKTLADAQAKATDIVQEAQARGMTLANDARAKADKLRADGEQAKKDAVAEGADIRKEAAKYLADAQVRLTAAEAARAQARSMADTHDSAERKAAKALADYQQAKSTYDAKLQRLKAFIAELDSDS